MKKVLLISMVASSAMFADMMTDMAKDMAVSKAKTQAKETVVKQVAGNDPVKQQVANKIADKVAPEPSPTDKIKSAVADKVMGGNAKEGASPLDNVVKGAAPTKETSVKEKAADMAVEKAVGSNPIKKEAAKKAIKSLGM